MVFLQWEMSLGSLGPCVLAVPQKGSELCTSPAVHGKAFTASLSSVTAPDFPYYLRSDLNATKSGLNPNCTSICYNSPLQLEGKACPHVYSSCQHKY